MSTLKVNAIQNTSGVEKYLASAWVRFNGTGTVAINGSGNVSTITDGGTGDYTVNFTTVMSDTNYAVSGSCGSGVAGSCGRSVSPLTLTTSGVRVQTGYVSTASALEDDALITIIIFR